MRNDTLGDGTRLEHMLFAIEEIGKYLVDSDYEVFARSSLLQNTILH